MLTFLNGEPAGTLVATIGAQESGIALAPLIRRHLSYDWGEMPPEDVERNNLLLAESGGVMSSYTIEKTTIWIITDPGHEVTTILLPKEY